MTKPDKQIEVVVVVSGVPRAASIKPNQKLQHLVKDVLAQSGDQQPRDFDLRTESGELLDLDRTAEDVGLHDGQTLFLSPHAGAAG